MHSLSPPSFPPSFPPCSFTELEGEEEEEGREERASGRRTRRVGLLASSSQIEAGEKSAWVKEEEEGREEGREEEARERRACVVCVVCDKRKAIDGRRVRNGPNDEE